MIHKIRTGQWYFTGGRNGTGRKGPLKDCRNADWLKSALIFYGRQMTTEERQAVREQIRSCSKRKLRKRDAKQKRMRQQELFSRPTVSKIAPDDLDTELAFRRWGLKNY